MESKALMTDKRIANIMSAYEAEPADFIRWVISIAGYFVSVRPRAFLTVMV
jgi:hypothetical protein